MAEISEPIRLFAEEPERLVVEPLPPVRRFRTDAFTLILSPMPSMSNVSCVHTTEAGVDATIAEVRRMVGQAGYTRTVWAVGPSSRPANLGVLLAARGFVPADRPPFEPEMTAMALTEAPPAPPPNIETRPVRSFEEYLEIWHIAIEPFNAPQADAARGGGQRLRLADRQGPRELPEAALRVGARGAGAGAHRDDGEQLVLDVDLAPRRVAVDAQHDAARDGAGDVLPGGVLGVAGRVAQRRPGGVAEVQVAGGVRGAGRVLAAVVGALVDDGDDDRLAAVRDLRAGAAVIDGVEVVHAGDGGEGGGGRDVRDGVRALPVRLGADVAAGRAVAQVVLVAALAERVVRERARAVVGGPGELALAA